ncbi:MFS transporter, partial [Klebsiella aerogenes]
GWLTDRYDPRKLLFVYYGLRGLSLLALPFLDFSASSLLIFAIFYGLDWIATVPPTVKLANVHFGERDAPVVFGWVMV